MINTTTLYEGNDVWWSKKITGSRQWNLLPLDRQTLVKKREWTLISRTHLYEAITSRGIPYTDNINSPMIRLSSSRLKSVCSWNRTFQWWWESDILNREAHIQDYWCYCISAVDSATLQCTVTIIRICAGWV